MSFPPKQVFIDYLNLYYSVRAEERASWGTYLKSAVEKVASYATGSGPVATQLDSHLTTMEAAINAAEDFDDWFNLIFTLRKTAEECQDAKWTNGVSLSCLVLHGTASLILCKLHEDPIYKEKLLAEINKRVERISELTISKTTALTKKNGQNISIYMEEITKLTSELAQLSEIAYIEEACRYKLFEYLPKRTDVEIITFTSNATCKGNQVGLLELQLNFCEWFYASTFQTTKKHVGFRQFLQESDMAYKQLLSQQETAKKRISILESAAATADSSNRADTTSADNSSSDSPHEPASSSSAAAAAAASPSSASTVTTGFFSSTAPTAKRDTAAAKRDKSGTAKAANDDTTTPRRHAQ